MRQLDSDKWQAKNFREFSERIAIAVCTPQKDGFTRVNAWIDRIDSSGEDSAFIVNLSCLANYHPFHQKRNEECVEFSDVLSGKRNDKYEEFHPAVNSYFDRILKYIKEYSSDLYEGIRSRRKLNEQRSLSLELFLDE